MPSRMQPQPHTTKVWPWPLVSLQEGAELGAEHPLKQRSAGPLIAVQPSPAWSCTCISGTPLLPVDEVSAALELSSAGAASPAPPCLGEAAAAGLIPQPPSPGPCFTSRRPSTDQSALKFALHSLQCSQRKTRCCQQPLAAGMGLSLAHHSHLLITTHPVGLRTLGIAQHQLPTMVPGFAALPLLRHCWVSCLALPVLACEWRVTAALGTGVVTVTVWELEG